MKYEEARKLLKQVINGQQSIRTKKLSRILQAMNVSWKEKTPKQKRRS